MAVYSYAQLEQLWLDAAKGTRYATRTWAALMAAIAEAESGGNSDARNAQGPPYASGLWQIKGLPFPGNVFDPGTNARMAVAKLQEQGLGAWETYDNGAYKAYLSNSTTPDPNVPGSATATASLAAAYGSADCLIGFGGIPGTSFFNDIFGSGGNVGATCFVTKSNVRGWVGAGLLVGGTLLALPGLVLLAAAAGSRGERYSRPARQTLTTVYRKIPGRAGKAAADEEEAVTEEPAGESV